MSETVSRPDQGVIVIEDETLKAGFTQIPNGILRNRVLSPGAKLVYMGILSYAWQQGSCFPGQEQLALDLGISKRSVVTHLQELKQAQFLRVQRRGLGKTNLYFLPRITPVLEPDPLPQNNVRSGSAKSALQEMQNLTLAEVQNLRREEYPTKNTQIEKYPVINSKRGNKQFFSNSNREGGLGETSSLAPTAEFVDNPNPANIPLASSPPKAISESYHPSLEESNLTTTARPQHGLRRVGESLAQRAADHLQRAPVEPSIVQKSADLGQSGLEDHSTPDPRKPDPRRRGRPRKIRTDYLDAIITDFSNEFHDEHHLPSNLSQARNLLQASGLAEDTFVQYKVYPARSIVREQGNVRKYQGEGSTLRNKMPYFFSCLRDLLGMREDEAGPLPPIHQTRGGSSRSDRTDQPT